MKYRYKPILQTKFNKNGNCLPACISTLFEININDVPYFGEKEESWVVEFSRWLNEKSNKYAMLCKLGNMKDVSIFNNSMLITIINSNNPEVERHAVISVKDRIIFDPMTGEVEKIMKKEFNPTYVLIGDVLNEKQKTKSRR
jgi:hypothetical protein